MLGGDEPKLTNLETAPTRKTRSRKQNTVNAHPKHVKEAHRRQNERRILFSPPAHSSPGPFSSPQGHKSTQRLATPSPPPFASFSHAAPPQHRTPRRRTENGATKTGQRVKFSQVSHPGCRTYRLDLAPFSPSVRYQSSNISRRRAWKGQCTGEEDPVGETYRRQEADLEMEEVARWLCSRERSVMIWTGMGR